MAASIAGLTRDTSNHDAKTASTRSSSIYYYLCVRSLEGKSKSYPNRSEASYQFGYEIRPQTLRASFQQEIDEPHAH
jgi:hypothetical protein